MNQPAQTNTRQKAIFISDLHLQPALPETTRAFLDFLKTQGQQTERLYILGDLFEYWAGDDDMDSEYLKTVVGALRALADSGTDIFWICGNRDFLTGSRFLEATGAKALPEPAVIELAGKKIALVHGDAQCTDDQAYMQFRTMVRNPLWQKQFLGMPLAQRKALIAGMREDSQKGNREKSAQMMDVNATAVDELFAQTGATVLIHGHTHHPGDHAHRQKDGECTRLVLSDWNLDAEPKRGDWIALTPEGKLVRHTC